MRRAALFGLAILVAAPVLLAIAATVWFDPVAIRARLQESAARATGRAVMIDGPLTLTWGPSLRIEGLRVLNPPGLSRPDLARVGSAEIGMALLPLVFGRVELRGVRLDGVDVLLERDGSGRGNWERPPAPVPAEPGAPASPPGRRWEVSLDSAILTDATLAYRDTGRVWVAQVPRLVIEDGHRATGDLVLDGVPVHVAGTGPFPLTLQLAADRVPIAAMAVDATRLMLKADGPDAPVRLDGTAMLGGAPVTLMAGASSLSGVMVEGTLDRISLALGGATVMAEGRLDLRHPAFTVRAQVPAVSVLGAAFGQAWPDIHDGTLTAQVTRTGAGVAVVGRGAVAGSDAAFRLAVGWPRPRLDGMIDVGVLDLDRLLTAPAATTVAAPSPPPPPPPVSPAMPPITVPGAASPALVPAVPTRLPFAALDRADGDLRLTAGTVRWRRTDAAGLIVHAVLDHGTLTVDGAHAVLGGGPIDARLVAVAAPPRAGLTVLAPGSDAAALAAWAGVVPAVTGRAELDLQLDGTGPDGPALLNSAVGRIGVAMVGGEADLAAIPGLAAGLAQVTRGMPAMGAMQGRTPIRCLALRMNLAGGRATVAALVLDTPRLTLSGDGTVGLTDRTLALALRPSVAVGSAIVSAPLRMTGPWATPAIKMEGEGGRAGISIATVAEPDPCGPALALARNGRPGPTPPAPDAAKPVKPADLLRSLLR